MFPGYYFASNYFHPYYFPNEDAVSSTCLSPSSVTYVKSECIDVVVDLLTQRQAIAAAIAALEAITDFKPVSPGQDGVVISKCYDKKVALLTQRAALEKKLAALKKIVPTC